MSRYDFGIDVKNTISVYHRVITWAGTGKRVLDVGCDTGNLGEYLKKTAVKVDGIEMDPAAAERAKSKLDLVVCGSVEDERVLSALAPPYDVIIFADVLEHLAYPEKTLERIKPMLSPDGIVIASLPNVANFRVRFSLLFGRFEYTEIGILDRTHLRFFTRKTAGGLFEKAGYKVMDTRPAATHMPRPALLSWPELFATRFVVKAGKGGGI